MSELIVKDNALMNASYNLALVEQRLILLAIIKARESGKGINANDPLTVHAEGYVSQFQVSRQTAYQSLKDACRDLFARQFSYQQKNCNGNITNITSRWVSQIGYTENEATVQLVFAPAVVPLITRLEDQFTKYDIEQISNLSSAYAVRMYELLICWRSTGKTPVIELDEFRKRIGVLDTEYTRTDNLKMRVIELALKQINDHTDITASYEQFKKGRKIVGFSFIFKLKKQKTEKDKKVIDAEYKEVATAVAGIFYELSDKQATFFSKKLANENYNVQQIAHDGETMQELQYRVRNILLNPQRSTEKVAKIVFNELKNAGFDPKKSNAKPLENIEFFQEKELQVPQKNDDEKRELAKMHISALLSRMS